MALMNKHTKTDTSHQLMDLPHELPQRVFQKVSEGIMITNLHGEIVLVNPAFELVTGYAKEEVLGHTPKLLQSGQHDASFYSSMWKQIGETGEWQGEIWNRRKNGDLYPECLYITAIKDASGAASHYCGIFTDLTEGKAAAQELKEMAHSDPLTGLSNRLDFTDRMTHLIRTAAVNDFRHSVLILDLDRFKQINESLGLEAGDRLLIEVGQRLRNKLASKDVLARYGADEFVIALAAIKHPKKAASLAKELIQELERPFCIDGNEIRISASVGISLYPDDGATEKELLQKAEQALYSAKKFGSGQFLFFHADLYPSNTWSMESELRRAIEEKQFYLNYQPKISLTDGSFLGMEALVRWNSDRLGFVSPGEFIPLAETSGLIIPLSEQIIEQACTDFLKYEFEQLLPAVISLNISGVHFRHPEFLGDLFELFEKMNCQPRHFELELTEGALMGEHLEAEHKLMQLKRAGFGVSIDDFGTGYSSLSYLQRFRVDWLKIDRIFIKELTAKEENRHIVEAIIRMAHSLRLKVVAEGAETEKEITVLKQLGCDAVQGYVFAKPMPAEDIRPFIEKSEFLKIERALL